MEFFDSFLAQFDAALFASYATRFFMAAFLGVCLSFQRSPDRYRLDLMEAHALLAIAGAMFIIIIGGNFVTAVGLLGAASVVRYRYAIRNPRDASTLILALGIGMACGNDNLLVATMGTFLILIISYMISLFPEVLPISQVSSREEKILRIQGIDYDHLMGHTEKILLENKIEQSLVSFEKKYRKQGTEVVYEVNFQVIMSAGISLHDLTHQLVDEKIYRVSWHEKPVPR